MFLVIGLGDIFRSGIYSSCLLGIQLGAYVYIHAPVLNFVL